eukprot:g932.t1
MEDIVDLMNIGGVVEDYISDSMIHYRNGDFVACERLTRKAIQHLEYKINKFDKDLSSETTEQKVLCKLMRHLATIYEKWNPPKIREAQVLLSRVRTLEKTKTFGSTVSSQFSELPKSSSSAFWTRNKTPVSDEWKRQGNRVERGNFDLRNSSSHDAKRETDYSTNSNNFLSSQHTEKKGTATSKPKFGIPESHLRTVLRAKSEMRKRDIAEEIYRKDNARFVASIIDIIQVEKKNEGKHLNGAYHAKSQKEVSILKEVKSIEKMLRSQVVIKRSTIDDLKRTMKKEPLKIGECSYFIAKKYISQHRGPFAMKYLKKAIINQKKILKQLQADLDQMSETTTMSAGSAYRGRGRGRGRRVHGRSSKRSETVKERKLRIQKTDAVKRKIERATHLLSNSLICLATVILFEPSAYKTVNDGKFVIGDLDDVQEFVSRDADRIVQPVAGATLAHLFAANIAKEWLNIYSTSDERRTKLKIICSLFTYKPSPSASSTNSTKHEKKIEQSSMGDKTLLVDKPQAEVVPIVIGPPLGKIGDLLSVTLEELVSGHLMAEDSEDAKLVNCLATLYVQRKQYRRAQELFERFEFCQQIEKSDEYLDNDNTENFKKGNESGLWTFSGSKTNQDESSNIQSRVEEEEYNLPEHSLAFLSHPTISTAK